MYATAPDERQARRPARRRGTQAQPGFPSADASAAAASAVHIATTGQRERHRAASRRDTTENLLFKELCRHLED